METNEETAVPGYRNYLIYTDESGMHRGPYYGFGSLWLPWERRGDLAEQLRALRDQHRLSSEVKWTAITKKTEPFYQDLLSWFFQRQWLMFHCVLVRRDRVDTSLHKDRDQAQQKAFSMLLRNKIAYFGRGGGKLYRVRVDPLPWRYAKADEVVWSIVNAELKKDIGEGLIHDLFARNSKVTDGIQLVDVLLGAVLGAWQGQADAPHKLRVMQSVAEHLGWPSLRHDTYQGEWKFNVWHFHDPRGGLPREASTKAVKLKYPMPAFRPKVVRRKAR